MITTSYCRINMGVYYLFEIVDSYIFIIEIIKHINILPQILTEKILTC